MALLYVGTYVYLYVRNAIADDLYLFIDMHALGIDRQIDKQRDRQTLCMNIYFW